MHAAGARGQGHLCTANSKKLYSIFRFNQFTNYPNLIWRARVRSSLLFSLEMSKKRVYSSIFHIFAFTLNFHSLCVLTAVFIAAPGQADARYNTIKSSQLRACTRIAVCGWKETENDSERERERLKLTNDKH